MPLDLASRQSIELACQRLSLDYARHVDFANYDACADLFALDGFLNAGGPLSGREKIRRALHRRSPELRSRHVLTNICIDVTDEKHATGITYLTLFRHVGPESLADAPVQLTQPAAVGQYIDEFTHTDEGWRISRRELSMAFQNPAAFPPAKQQAPART